MSQAFQPVLFGIPRQSVIHWLESLRHYGWPGIGKIQKVAIMTEKQTAPAESNGTKSTMAKDVLRAFLLAAGLAGFAWSVYKMPWGKQSAADNVVMVRDWIEEWGAFAWIGFLIVGGAVVTIGFPRIAMAFVGGALFGVAWGTVLGLAVALLAAVPVYAFTRLVGSDLVTRRMGARLQRMDSLLQENAFMVILLIRFCPVGNHFLVNYFAGVAAIPFGAFMLASMIGCFPETFIFALLGGGFVENFNLRLWTSVGLFLCCSLITIWYYRRSLLAARIMRLMRQE
ncbi:MAG: VTT domain-containing protein [Candidatus Sumerlaeota bacterium]|nr:VTT domain-containing protein [Candidatus Sumerlaeota bacterium]